jgi:copper ion binding protein
MKKVTYEVPAINCMHCVHTIKTELGEIPGVLSVEADTSTKKVVVAYDEPADETQIEELLEEINYPVKK